MGLDFNRVPFGDLPVVHVDGNYLLPEPATLETGRKDEPQRRKAEPEGGPPAHRDWLW